MAAWTRFETVLGVTARIASHMLVGAIVRRAHEQGGFATIVHKGDATSGVIIIQTLEKGVETGLYERIPNGQGEYEMTACGAQYWGNHEQVAQYIDRRTRSDPDLWLIELDIPEPQRFIAEI
jgi:hypothetical protein